MDRYVVQVFEDGDGRFYGAYWDKYEDYSVAYEAYPTEAEALKAAVEGLLDDLKGA